MNSIETRPFQIRIDPPTVNSGIFNCTVRIYNTLDLMKMEDTDLQLGFQKLILESSLSISGVSM